MGEYRYDIISLECDLRDAHEKWKDDNNDKTRTDLFQSIHSLCLAILYVGSYEKYKIDYESTSYEYSLYLFERLMVRSFNPVSSGPFPWTAYIRKNVKHVILSSSDSKTWQEIISDLGYFVDQGGVYEVVDLNSETPEEALHRKEFSWELYKALRIFYSVEDIQRLLHFSIDIIYNNPQGIVSKRSKIDRDVRDFTAVIICLAKRLADQSNFNVYANSKKELRDALSSATRSTIFLSAITNSEFFNRDLLLALDIDSLYRIVSIAGGQTIRIPTLEELNTLIGVVFTVSKILMENRNPEKALYQVKTDMDLVFSRHINLEIFISKILETYELCREDSRSAPLIDLLGLSIQSLESLIRRFGSSNFSGNALLSQYVELSASFSKFTQSLLNIRDHVVPNGGVVHG